jgi:hypothetical protein
MEKNLKIIYKFCFLVLILVLLSCAVHTIPPKPSQSEYLDIDYRRFVSGVYVDELANKYVKLDCRFAYTMAGTLPGGYSYRRYMSFEAVSPIHRESAESLTVVVPKDVAVADVVFTLRHGENIKVYGRAVPVITRTVAGQIYKSLILQADLIQKQ